MPPVHSVTFLRFFLFRTGHVQWARCLKASLYLSLCWHSLAHVLIEAFCKSPFYGSLQPGAFGPVLRRPKKVKAYWHLKRARFRNVFCHDKHFGFYREWIVSVWHDFSRSAPKQWVLSAWMVSLPYMFSFRPAIFVNGCMLGQVLETGTFVLNKH